MVAQSGNYRYSTNLQVVIDADTELVVALGRPLPGNRNDCRAWTESGAADACRNAVVIADGGHGGTGVFIPHRRSPLVSSCRNGQLTQNKSPRKVRARVERPARGCRFNGPNSSTETTRPSAVLWSYRSRIRFIFMANSGSAPASHVLTACHDTPSAFKILRRVSRRHLRPCTSSPA
ncbi:transposase [Nocardia mangyaensis]|uniref:transposase n=1 Tax=Nocardia mangyaensis TaxID=2213200 RepID=UPI003F583D3F